MQCFVVALPTELCFELHFMCIYICLVLSANGLVVEPLPLSVNRVNLLVSIVVAGMEIVPTRSLTGLYQECTEILYGFRLVFKQGGMGVI